MQKKRILFVGEASFLSTGFSTYYRELLPRLAATGKYEIAELGCYADGTDPRVESFIQGRWKFYSAKPANEQEHHVFVQPCPHPRAQGQNTNQFGEWKFDAVVADFKPDIVIDIRDWWMLEFQERSVFRPWFKWVVMPTVDAEPQREEWMATYENADMVLAYSDYGVHALKRQSMRARVFPTPMRPGVDTKTFRPMDRREVAEHFGINPDIPVVGTVMRNQSRKLYPDLIDAFAIMKKKYEGHKRIDDSILLIHSTWPDNAHSFDYPRHIMRLQSYEWVDYHWKGIKDCVMQSVMCHNCGAKGVTFAVNLYGRQPERIGDSAAILMPCTNCGQKTATAPTTGGGYSREDLAKLYNLMDLYIQCSICEGDGMPIQEAKACGVPTLVPAYTAMREKGEFPKDYVHFDKLSIDEGKYSCHLGGDIIKIGRFYEEPETACKRAHPSREHMADQMAKYLMDEDARKQLADDAVRCVETNYDWDKIWRKWEMVIDGIKPKDRSSTWDSPIEISEGVEAKEIPEGLDDGQYVEWLYTEVLGYPRTDPQGAEMWLKYLQQGVDRNALLQQFLQIGNSQSDAGNARQRIRAQVAGVAPETKETKNHDEEWM